MPFLQADVWHILLPLMYIEPVTGDGKTKGGPVRPPLSWKAMMVLRMLVVRVVDMLHHWDSRSPSHPPPCRDGVATL